MVMSYDSTNDEYNIMIKGYPPVKCKKVSDNVFETAMTDNERARLNKQIATSVIKHCQDRLP